MKISLEFEQHEQREVISYLEAQDEAAILHDFREALRQILKHSDDDKEVEHAQWASDLLNRME